MTLLVTFIASTILALHFVSNKVFDPFTSNDHAFGITIIIGKIIAYGSVLFFFSRKSNFALERASLALEPKVLFLLLLLSIGFRMIGEPFWDFDQIFGSAEATSYSIKHFPPIFFYQTFVTLLIAPVLEELFFRKFLITELLKKHKKVTALVVSAVLSATLHWESLSNLIPAFIFGIITGLIFIKTRRVMYTIILHFLFNLLGVIITLKGQVYFEIIQWFGYGILYWSLFVLGIFITLFALKKIPSEATCSEVNPDQ